MKPLPTPAIPGHTPWERMDHALRTILNVPKDVILREEAKEKRKRERKKKQKPRSK